MQQIASGGEQCACIIDKDHTGFIATLHEFASSERIYLQQLNNIANVLLKPLLISGIQSQYLATVNVIFYQYTNKMKYTLIYFLCVYCKYIVSNLSEHIVNMLTTPVGMALQLLMDAFFHLMDLVRYSSTIIFFSLTITNTNVP